MSEQVFSHQDQRVQRLLQIAVDLASTLNINELLKQILSAAVEFSHAEEASILLYDAQRQELFIRAATNGETEETLKEIAVPTESIAGWVALNRQPIIVDDVHQDPRWFSQVGEALQFPTRSLLAIPMIAKEQLIGVLELLNKKEGRFNEEDLEILTVLSAQAAVVIQTAQLFAQSDQISTLVHELRTPLASINTIAYLLQHPGLSNSKRLELTQMIQTETDRLNKMTTAFLDLARMETGRAAFNWSSFSLEELAQECLNLCQPRATQLSITLSLDYPPALPTILADRDKIKQVLLNLLNNAVQYNHPGGQVTLHLHHQDADFELHVQDTGPGIPPEDLPKLFTKFYRAPKNEKASPGTGLGLTICKQIVESHGGKIGAESQPGVGTTFWIRLPQTSKSARVPRQPRE